LGFYCQKMKIHLIRHAKTASVSLSGNDFDRKLLLKGVVQANVLGSYIQNKEIQPELTFCSMAVRTKETYSILQHLINVGKTTFSTDLYLCDRETYLKKIWELNHGKELMIIGHNDGISEFASYLTDETLSMRTSEYYCIELPAKTWDEVSFGTGTVIDHFHPSVYLLD
jgi:phosphohistidine phosphatase